MCVTSQTEMKFNCFDLQIIFKKKDENEEYDQQSKLAQQYARLDPSALNSAMDESKHFQVQKDRLKSVLKAQVFCISKLITFLSKNDPLRHLPNTY